MKPKSTISEGDVALLLRRYDAKVVLALLQEVSKCASVKIDWNSLVKNTTTGITNAQEYQMLWRNLAYHATLPDKYEDDAQPLDDDSDLDFEIEPSLPVGDEALAEAAACVKVLETSGIPDNSGQPSHSIVEAPLTINIPSPTCVSDGCANNNYIGISTQGMNITVPVSIQKQPLTTIGTSEGVDGNASLISPAHPVRRKRKLWTAEEDEELIAAVHKCGEGNWSSILKGAFKHDRTASQLSQRWSLIRKRQVVLNQGTIGNSSSLSGTVDTLQSPVQAVALSGSSASGISVNVTVAPTMAVAANSTATASVTVSSSSTILPVASTVTGISLIQSSAVAGPDNFVSQLSQGNQGQEQGPLHATVGTPGVSATLTYVKSRPKTKKHVANKSNIGRLISPMPPPATTAAAATASTPIKIVSLPGAGPGRYANTPSTQPGTGEGIVHGSSMTLSGPHPMVQAAAVAAGARIAPASAHASLLKAAQSGSVVHIGVGGVPFSKSGYASQSGTICGMSNGSNSARASGGAGSMRPPNVHYFRTGSVPSPPVYSGITTSVQKSPASQPKGPAMKPATTGLSILQSSRTNLVSATKLSATQASESSDSSQIQPLNQAIQVTCASSNAPVLSSIQNSKSQTSQCVSEALQTVQSDSNLKPPLIATSFLVHPSLTHTTDQMPNEQGASLSAKASVSPAVEIGASVTSSLSASISLCPMVEPCRCTDVPTDIGSIPVFSDSTVVNDGMKVKDDKSIELEKDHSSFGRDGSLLNQECSEKSKLGESTEFEAHYEKNNEKNIEMECIAGSNPDASELNVSSSTQNILSDEPLVENVK